MSENQILELLNAPAMQVGQMDNEIAQREASLEYEKERERIRCRDRERAREAMYLARRCGIDAFCRGAVITVTYAFWQVGAIEKLKIFGG